MYLYLIIHFAQKVEFSRLIVKDQIYADTTCKHRQVYKAERNPRLIVTEIEGKGFFLFHPLIRQAVKAVIAPIHASSTLLSVATH
ncbi:hypothetical protein FisN_27Lu028 [Fistulifera solaris]|uniref:Uncharacterized protein n=1 Tax=Fistulifera solaris TaxID=1519565 RepID=A0A1Z5JHP6_FISSO|nr:hypothetical protein FisN_27Lu028 [Fistulifera solaris]|eukprot:GAX13533.1 hypothetical protein FisN_27Lu028 [Fistulifera solaris]